MTGRVALTAAEGERRSLRVGSRRTAGAGRRTRRPAVLISLGFDRENWVRRALIPDS